MNYKMEFKNLYEDVFSGEKQRIKRQVPNMLTLIRGILTPILMIVAAVTQKIELAFAVIVISSLTDCIDGWFARKYEVTSEFGATLDTVCDKLFTLFVIVPIFLSATKYFFCVLLLELIISIINVTLKIKGRKPKSSILGKVKTVILDCSVGLCYLKYLIHIDDRIIQVALEITIAMQIVTIIGYIKNYLIQMKDEKVNLQ